MTQLSIVTSCQASGCAFNNDGCAAGAITLGGADTATCATQIEIDARGGLQSANGQVGACQHLECTHNTHLLCGINDISLDAKGICLSYDRAS